MADQTQRIYAYKNSFILGNTEFSVFCDWSFLSGAISKTENQTLHNHFFNEILIIESGDGCFESTDKEEDFFAGDVLFLPKNKLHLLKSQNYKYYSIGFTIKKIANNSKIYSSYDNFSEIFSSFFHLKGNLEFLTIAKEIATNVNKPSTFSYYVIQALLQKLILRLAEENASFVKKQDNQIPLIADFNFEINQRINNLKDNAKLKDIASDLFISERQLSRIIKKQYGVSFTERKNQLRIESAKQLIENTNLTILEICEKVSFNDNRAFTKQFVKRVGVTPNEYRKSLK